MEAAVLNSGNTKSPLRFITKSVSGVWNFLISISESNARMRQVQQLNAMSDDDLAKKGLKREDIVRHIFSDVIYL